jgi:hypothetical protein
VQPSASSTKTPKYCKGDGGRAVWTDGVVPVRTLRNRRWCGSAPGSVLAVTMLQQVGLSLYRHERQWYLHGSVYGLRAGQLLQGSLVLLDTQEALIATTSALGHRKVAVGKKLSKRWICGRTLPEIAIGTPRGALSIQLQPSSIISLDVVYTYKVLLDRQRRPRYDLSNILNNHQAKSRGRTSL